MVAGAWQPRGFLLLTFGAGHYSDRHLRVSTSMTNTKLTCPKCGAEVRAVNGIKSGQPAMLLYQIDEDRQHKPVCKGAKA